MKEKCTGRKTAGYCQRNKTYKEQGKQQWSFGEVELQKQCRWTIGQQTSWFSGASTGSQGGFP